MRTNAGSGVSSPRRRDREKKLVGSGNTLGAVIALGLGIGIAYIVLSGHGVNFANAIAVYTGSMQATPAKPSTAKSSSSLPFSWGSIQLWPSSSDTSQ